MKEKMMRLSLVARKLNVSLETVRDTLYSLGQSIDRNPNAKLSSDQLRILEEEWNTNVLLGGENVYESSAQESKNDEILYFRDDHEIEKVVLEPKPIEPRALGKIDLDKKPTKEVQKYDEVVEKIKMSGSVKALNLSGQYLFRIPKELAELTNLKKLVLAKNQIRQLENLPPNLTELDISENQIEKLTNLPEKLISLNIRLNKIQSIEGLPDCLFR